MSDHTSSTTRTSSEASVFERYRRAVRDEAPAPPRRPWLLSGVAFVCAVAVVVGSLGPWFYRESNSRTLGTFETDLLSGWQTDGLFALIFAVAAVVAIAIANIRPDSEWVAWIGFAAMALCALIGLWDWDMFGNRAAIHEARHPLNEADRRWGLTVVAIASPIGAICAFFIARLLNRE